MSHKRKYRKAAPKGTQAAATTTTTTTTAPDFSLFIQAYEATIIRGPQSISSALSLEAPGVPTLANDCDEPRIGSALIQWGASTRIPQPLNSDSSSFPGASSDDARAIWVDRYDARLLLDALPEHATLSASPPRSLSPTAWSDLPSDSEDTFFFTSREIDDYQRGKRRRLIDQNREKRLRALAANEEIECSDLWGGSDEEPDDPQSDLMRRTAVHLLSSPNPAQLEMRILANHGADERFAFLRGRWSRSWRMTKEKARQEKVSQNALTVGASHNAGLGGLAAYGDSEEEFESGDISVSSLDVGESSGPTLDSFEDRSLRLEETKKAARRAKAREWAAQRRARQGDEDRANP